MKNKKKKKPNRKKMKNKKKKKPNRKKNEKQKEKKNIPATFIKFFFVKYQSTVVM